MAKVLCTSPNASEEISGIKFEKTDEGMLSEDISDDLAAELATIPGYSIDGDSDGNGTVDLAELTAKATELGIAVKTTWKAARLTAEIARAETAKAAAKVA